jgi:NAD(P)-dependent dehydrogenase (short-subunit alcohol dehydrogenase family)
MISPASRGIGFALARRVLQTTNAPVVVTARKDLDKTKEQLLEGLDIDEARLRVMRLDVTGTMLIFIRCSKDTKLPRRRVHDRRCSSNM